MENCESIEINKKGKKKEKEKKRKEKKKMIFFTHFFYSLNALSP